MKFREEKLPVPWEIDPEEKETGTDFHVQDEQQKPSKWQRLIERLPKPAYIGICATVVVLILISSGKEKKAKAPSYNNSIEVLVAKVPIPKGSPISPELFRSLGMRRNDFSKAKRLQLIRPEDIQSTEIRFRAKKDLPPMKPVYWSSIEMLPLPGSLNSAQKKKPKIIYSED